MSFFNLILIDPMANIMVMLYSILFNNFGLAIIVFTVIARLITLPLTLKQTRQMKAMQALQPRMRDLQEKYSKDPERKRKETMLLYREARVNPLGCLGPMLVLIVVWLGLYRALIKTLGTNPDDLVGLAQRLYTWNPWADTAVPINSNFFGMDLANPDPSPLIMPILVGVSTWAQQKMTMVPSTDPRQSSTNSMMLWTMPLVLGFITLSFPSGLALYWVVSNLIGVAIQGFMTRDWTPLTSVFTRKPPVPQPTPEPAQEAQPKEMDNNARTSNIRKNRRRGPRDSAERARGKPRGSRNRNIKPR